MVTNLLIITFMQFYARQKKDEEKYVITVTGNWYVCTPPHHLKAKCIVKTCPNST